VLDGCRYVLDGCRYVLDGCRYVLDGCRYVLDGCRYVLDGCRYVLDVCRYVLDGCRGVVVSVSVGCVLKMYLKYHHQEIKDCGQTPPSQREYRGMGWRERERVGQVRSGMNS
jgi:hypothetical protein